jgi:hypothetical protein
MVIHLLIDSRKMVSEYHDLWLLTKSRKMLSQDFENHTWRLSTRSSTMVSGYSWNWIQPSTAPLSIIIFERMLLISAVLSLISAVVAILTVKLSQRRFAKQTGSRSPAYVPNHIVAMTIILLHLSMFLFLVGLVTFFLAIHKIVAAVVSAAVGVLYLTLTILGRPSSYRTPLSRSLATIVFHSPL